MGGELVCAGGRLEEQVDQLHVDGLEALAKSAAPAIGCRHLEADGLELLDRGAIGVESGRGVALRTQDPSSLPLPSIISIFSAPSVSSKRMM